MRFKKANPKIAKIAAKIISQDFPQLKCLNILYVFRGKPKNADDGMITAGEVRILPAKIQDLYHYNAEIELARPIWEAMNLSQRKRLIWHELRHLKVEMGEDDKTPATDKDGRISCYCEDHDLVMRTFSQELRQFGLERSHLKILKTLYNIYKDYKAGKIRKIKTFKLDDKEVDMG